MAMGSLINLFLMLLCLTWTSAQAQLDHTSSINSSDDFIKRSCKITLYPALCFQCLSGYANSIQPPGRDKQLAQAALQISLSKARSALNFVSKLSSLSGSVPSREYQVLKDCFATLGDSLYELSHSLNELDGVSKSPVANHRYFSWHMSNVKTWVSAALTDDSTCLDGFSGSSNSNIDGNLKANIKSKVNDVAQVTSISLAFVNRFANGHPLAAP